MISNDKVIKRLEELPVEIEEAERRYLIAYEYLEEAKRALLEKECVTFNEGLIEGRNAMQRDAEMYPYTISEHEAVKKASVRLDYEKIPYRRLKRELEGMLSISKLLQR